MLIKFLFLLFLAYWISRTIGNLIRAARGGNTSGRERGRYRSFSTGTEAHSRRTSDSAQSPQDSRLPYSDVEDARWTDVR